MVLFLLLRCFKKWMQQKSFVATTPKVWSYTGIANAITNFQCCRKYVFSKYYDHGAVENWKYLTRKSLFVSLKFMFFFKKIDDLQYFLCCINIIFHVIATNDSKFWDYVNYWTIKLWWMGAAIQLILKP